MIFQQLINDEAGCLSYLIGCARAGAAMIVDPGRDRVSDYISLARRKGLTLVLARRMGDVYPRAVRLVASGQVDVRSIVTHRFPLAETGAAFDAAERRIGLKVVVEP